MNDFLVRHAAQIVVDGVWQGLLVALCVGLALRVLPGVSAAQRFAIWAWRLGSRWVCRWSLRCMWARRKALPE